MCFKDISISDNFALSYLKCVKLSESLAVFYLFFFKYIQIFFQYITIQDKQIHLSKFDVEFDILNPSLIIYQHDLAWWIEYIRRLKLNNNIEQNSIKFFNKNKILLTPKQQLTNDFSSIEDILKQQNENDTILNNFKDNTQKQSIFKFYIQLGLTDFECQLKNVNGAAIFFGIELATFIGNNVYLIIIIKIVF